MRYIPIRVCSRVKSSINRGTLDQIYSEHMLQAFFKKFGKGCCVLSRKLGICPNDREYNNYFDHEMINHDLLDFLKVQRQQYKDVVFLYWNHRPLTHKIYIEIMRGAGCTVLEFRTLDGIQQFLNLAKQPWFDLKAYSIAAKSSQVDRELVNMVRDREGLIGWAKTSQEKGEYD